MTQRLVIAIDCDDVLVDSAKNIIETYNQLYNTKLQLKNYYVDDTTLWGVENIQIASERVHNIMETIAAELEPSPDAVRAIRELCKLYELHLVTGRNDSLLSATEQMVRDYFNGCFESIELTNHFSSTKKRTKGDVCKKISADILIDDHLEHIQSVLDAGLKEVVVFGDYPWNQVTNLPSGAVRCYDWAEAILEIERIASR